MTALQFPCTVFKTQHRLNDYGAKDMRCGDLSESQLKNHYRLERVSGTVNPYTLTKIDKSRPFQHPRLGAWDHLSVGKKISRQQCAALLFDEFRDLSKIFAIYGPYRYEVEKMITHMQNGNGRSFRSMYLDMALKEQINKDDSKDNSTRLLLKEALDTYINWENRFYPYIEKEKIYIAISGGRLPKFNRFKDNFNGLGITVHDTWATHITIKSLEIGNNRYRAVVHYKVQDHFGLDDKDILDFKFNSFRFFRIWFLLQRYNQFSFKPFMTNIEATIEITGNRVR